MQKVVWTIYPQFKAWLLDQIHVAAAYMVDRTTVSLTPREIFQALVPEQDWVLLSTAGALMPPKTYQQYNVELLNGIDELHSVNPKINVNVIFKHLPSDHILLPAKLNPIRHGSKLFEYLTPSLSLARDWATLHLVTKSLIELTDDRNMLANLFPWLPDLVRESGWILIPDEDAKTVNFDRLHKRKSWYQNELGITVKAERYACDRTFIAALRRRSPALALTDAVRDAVASGSRLFTQYRLAKQQTMEALTGSTIIPTVSKELVHPNIIKGLEDVKQIYKHERR